MYLAYAFGLLRPGTELPTFGEPTPFDRDLSEHTDDDLDLLIDEGRRQLDRQLHDLDSVRDRAGTLLTLGLAEVALLAASGQPAWSGPWWLASIWAVAAACAFLAAAGAASLLAGRADLGRTDARLAANQDPPIKGPLALGYLSVVAIGEETVRTRLTVLRSAATLAVLAALIYVPVFVAAS
ncbi:MAG: hypothetical protein QM711_03755 [Micropruina sp.]|uniref:hypothetical protein n=1 Tax=Micropruina sp. TaxID=2737536 RepID=UPI0039E5FD4C